MATGAVPSPPTWLELASTAPAPSRETVHRLIQDHLLHHCYIDTLNSFTSSTQPTQKDDDVDMMDVPQSLDNRKQVGMLIREGKIGEALRFCKVAFPAALDLGVEAGMEMFFLLQCQVFVELVRVNAPEAVRFAQAELGQFGILGPKYIDVLQDIVALIAYKDPLNSPVARLLSQERREEVAARVNNYILATENVPAQTKIEKLVSQLAVVTDTLHEQSSVDKKGGAATKPPFPKWDFESFIGADR